MFADLERRRAILELNTEWFARHRFQWLFRVKNVGKFRKERLLDLLCINGRGTLSVLFPRPETVTLWNWFQIVNAG